MAKDIDDFDLVAAAVDETLVRDLGGGGFIEQQRDVVLIGGTGSGTGHAAIAVARACVRRGAASLFQRGRPRRQARGRDPRRPPGRIADHLARLDLVVLDELGYLPFAQSSGQLLFHLISRLFGRLGVVVTNLAFSRCPSVSAMPG